MTATEREELRAAIMRYMARRRGIPLNAAAITDGVKDMGHRPTEAAMTEELTHLVQSGYLETQRRAASITPRYVSTPALNDAADRGEI